ncbi:50S ribosomal protein L11, partial [Mycoplasmopsis synoviae]
NTAKAIVAGTAKQMGVLVEGYDDVAKAKQAAREAAKTESLAKAKEESLKSQEEELKASKGKSIHVNVIEKEKE